MARRRRRNKNIQLPRDREEQMVRQVSEDVEDMLMSLSELEGDQDVIDDIAEGISELQDLIEAILYQSGAHLPKRLKRPWNIRDMS